MERHKSCGGGLTARQGRIVRRALRESAAANEDAARNLRPFGSHHDALLWKRAMKNAAEYRRLLKALAPSRWGRE